jgi:hypothetical protein
MRRVPGVSTYDPLVAELVKRKHHDQVDGLVKLKDHDQVDGLVKLKDHDQVNGLVKLKDHDRVDGVDGVNLVHLPLEDYGGIV